MSNLPQGWRAGKVEDSCDILDSQRKPVSSEERAKRKAIYPYYGANGLQGYIDDFIFDGELVLLAEDGGYFDEYSHRPICYLVKGKCWVNNHAHILRAKGGIATTKWIHYSLVHRNILEYINGGTRAKLNQSDLREIPLPLPPLPEQKKIADILSSVDKVIELTEAEIEKLEMLKKGTMQELLHFPDLCHSVKFDVYEFEAVIEKVIDYRGKSPPKSDRGIPLITAKNVRMGYLDVEPREYIRESDYDAWMTRGIPTSESVLFTTEAPMGFVCPTPAYKFALGQRVVCLTPKPKYLTHVFLMYLLQAEYIQKRILGLSSGSTALGIKTSELAKLPLEVPDKNYQVKAAKVLSSIDARIVRTEAARWRLVNLKKALMQDLLTGKVRVKV